MIKQPERLTSTFEVGFDETRACSIDAAIEYLVEMRGELGGDVSIYFGTTGYDDLDIKFTWTQVETDEEYFARLKLMEQSEQMRKLEKKAKEDAARDKRRKQYEELRKEFGE